MKKSRKVSIVFVVLYLLLVTGATIYCQRTYSSNLMTAYLTKPVRAQINYDGSIPKSLVSGEDGKYDNAMPRTCLSDDGTGKMKLNMIAEEEGPWGKRYKIKQTDVVYWPVDSESEYIVIRWRFDDSLPIAADVEADFVYEGMEVQLALR
jgi:hypothetical protein